MSKGKKTLMGLKECTSLMIGNMVGSGILMLPATLAIYGSASLFGWIITGFGSVILALIFGGLSRKIPITGGPYTYSQRAFGDFVGFQMAWNYWVGAWVSNAAVVIVLMGYLNSLTFVNDSFMTNLMSNFSDTIINISPSADPLAIFNLLVSLIIVWFLTWVNTLGVDIFSRMQNLLTFLKIVPLLFIGVVGIFFVDINNIFPFTMGNADSYTQAISAAAAITLFSFLGLESATIPADNVKDPEKTIPRATIMGTLIAAFIYIWISLVIMGVVSVSDLMNSAAPFTLAIEKMFGTNVANIMAFFGAFACFTVLNGWILIQGQVPLAASRDKLFPKIFSKLNKNNMPAFGLVITSILVSLLMIMNYGLSLAQQFEFIVNLTVFIILLPYLYTSIAYLMFTIADKEKYCSYQFNKSVMISLLGFGYTIWAIYSIGAEIVYLGTVFSLIGIPVYVWAKRK